MFWQHLETQERWQHRNNQHRQRLPVFGKLLFIFGKPFMQEDAGSYHYGVPQKQIASAFRAGRRKTA